MQVLEMMVLVTLVYILYKMDTQIEGVNKMVLYWSAVTATCIAAIACGLSLLVIKIQENGGLKLFRKKQVKNQALESANKLLGMIQDSAKRNRERLKLVEGKVQK